MSTSFDDTIRVSDANKDMSTVMSIPHNNATGRWVVGRGWADVSIGVCVCVMWCVCVRVRTAKNVG